MAISRAAIASNLRQRATVMFPSLWVRWHLMRRPRSAEAELSFLKNIVRREDVTVDVGANLGLYTRVLARLASKVHAFEPSGSMADILQRTTGSNVIVHALALSDHEGEAELRTPRSGTRLIHSLATIESDVVVGGNTIATKVPCARLDSVVHEHVSFVKVDVEGHELNVLRGARALIEKSRPVFLIEAEERHRIGATALLFAFFKDVAYDGFFLRGRDVVRVDDFDPRADQDQTALLDDGGRQSGRTYINNFFFFPPGLSGRDILARPR
jgi:FkbM family methyltransferase